MKQHNLMLTFTKKVFNMKNKPPPPPGILIVPYKRKEFRVNVYSFIAVPIFSVYTLFHHVNCPPRITRPCLFLCPLKRPALPPPRHFFTRLLLSTTSTHPHSEMPTFYMYRMTI